MCSDCLSSNRKPQAEAASISASTLAERLKRIPDAGRDTAALVFDLDLQPFVSSCPCSQDDAPAKGRGLEGVVQQIRHRRCQDLRVGIGRPRRITRLEDELKPPRLRVEPPGRGDVTQERRHSDPLAPLVIGGKTNLRKRAVNQVAQAHEASTQYGPGAAIDGDSALLQSLIREDCGIEQITSLVSEVSRPLEFLM